MKYMFLMLICVNLANSLELSEDGLLRLAMVDSPKLDEIKSNLLKSKQEMMQVDDGLSSNLYSGYQHQETNERAIIPFFPVYSNINQYNLGLRKNFKHGLDADLSASVDQRSGASNDLEFKDIHTTIFNLTLNFDLWRNLFGKLTKADLDNAKLNFESSLIKSKLEEKGFKILIRRLYWNLVASEEKIRISNGLLKQAEIQAKDARDRFRKSIADKGEVARYESQVASRKGSVLLLEYQKEQILKQLIEFIPALSLENIKLAKYNINQSVFEVLNCTEVISQKKEVPYEFTDYDELTHILRKIQSNQRKIDKSYDDIDVKLTTSFKQIGVASDDNIGIGTLYEGSYENSIRDIRNNDRSAFEAGIRVNIPLGDQKKTMKVKDEYNRRRLEASIKATDNNVVATHNQVVRQIKVLQEVIKTQKIHSEKLNTRLSEMKKKFTQARVSVSELVQDQDALLNSDLTIIDTQIEILNTLFDYFSIFTDLPCDFNK